MHPPVNVTHPGGNSWHSWHIGYSWNFAVYKKETPGTDISAPEKQRPICPQYRAIFERITLVVISLYARRENTLQNTGI